MASLEAKNFRSRWNEAGVGCFTPNANKEKNESDKIHVAASGQEPEEKSGQYKTFLPFSDGPRSCVGQVMLCSKNDTIISYYPLFII